MIFALTFMMYIFQSGRHRPTKEFVKVSSFHNDYTMHLENHKTSRNKENNVHSQSTTINNVIKKKKSVNIKNGNP